MIGRFARSIAGHDKGTLYVIVEVFENKVGLVGDSFLYGQYFVACLWKGNADFRCGSVLCRYDFDRVRDLFFCVVGHNVAGLQSGRRCDQFGPCDARPRVVVEPDVFSLLAVDNL